MNSRRKYSFEEGQRSRFSSSSQYDLSSEHSKTPVRTPLDIPITFDSLPIPSTQSHSHLVNNKKFDSKHSSDKQVLLDYIKELQSQLSKSEASYKSLKNSLNKTKHQRDQTASVGNLNQQMFQDFIHKVTKEKSRMEFYHMKHAKLIASKCIALELHRITFKRLRFLFNSARKSVFTENDYSMYPKRSNVIRDETKHEIYSGVEKSKELAKREALKKDLALDFNNKLYKYRAFSELKQGIAVSKHEKDLKQLALEFDSFQTNSRNTQKIVKAKYLTKILNALQEKYRYKHFAESFKHLQKGHFKHKMLDHTTKTIILFEKKLKSLNSKHLFDNWRGKLQNTNLIKQEMTKISESKVIHAEEKVLQAKKQKNKHLLKFIQRLRFKNILKTWNSLSKRQARNRQIIEKMQEKRRNRTGFEHLKHYYLRMKKVKLLQEKKRRKTQKLIVSKMQFITKRNQTLRKMIVHLCSKNDIVFQFKAYCAMKNQAIKCKILGKMNTLLSYKATIFAFDKIRHACELRKKQNLTIKHTLKNKYFTSTRKSFEKWRITTMKASFADDKKTSTLHNFCNMLSLKQKKEIFESLKTNHQKTTAMKKLVVFCFANKIKDIQRKYFMNFKHASLKTTLKMKQINLSKQNSMKNIMRILSSSNAKRYFIQWQTITKTHDKFTKLIKQLARKKHENSLRRGFTAWNRYDNITKHTERRMENISDLYQEKARLLLKKKVIDTLVKNKRRKKLMRKVVKHMMMKHELKLLAKAFSRMYCSSNTLSVTQQNSNKTKLNSISRVFKRQISHTKKNYLNRWGFFANTHVKMTKKLKFTLKNKFLAEERESFFKWKEFYRAKSQRITEMTYKGDEKYKKTLIGKTFVAFRKLAKRNQTMKKLVQHLFSSYHKKIMSKSFLNWNLFVEKLHITENAKANKKSKIIPRLYKKMILKTKMNYLYNWRTIVHKESIVENYLKHIFRTKNFNDLRSSFKKWNAATVSALNKKSELKEKLNALRGKISMQLKKKVLFKMTETRRKNNIMRKMLNKLTLTGNRKELSKYFTRMYAVTVILHKQKRKIISSIIKKKWIKHHKLAFSAWKKSVSSKNFTLKQLKSMIIQKYNTYIQNTFAKWAKLTNRLGFLDSSRRNKGEAHYERKQLVLKYKVTRALANNARNNKLMRRTIQRLFNTNNKNIMARYLRKLNSICQRISFAIAISSNHKTETLKKLLKKSVLRSKKECIIKWGSIVIQKENILKKIKTSLRNKYTSIIRYGFNSWSHFTINASRRKLRLKNIQEKIMYRKEFNCKKEIVDKMLRITKKNAIMRKTINFLFLQKDKKVLSRYFMKFHTIVEKFKILEQSNMQKLKDRVKSLLKRFEIRQKKTCFFRWGYKLIKQINATKLLRPIIREKYFSYLRNSFSKWKSFQIANNAKKSLFQKELFIRKNRMNSLKKEFLDKMLRIARRNVKMRKILKLVFLSRSKIVLYKYFTKMIHCSSRAKTRKTAGLKMLKNLKKILLKTKKIYLYKWGESVIKQDTILKILKTKVIKKYVQSLQLCFSRWSHYKIPRLHQTLKEKLFYIQSTRNIVAKRTILRRISQVYKRNSRFREIIQHLSRNNNKSTLAKFFTKFELAAKIVTVNNNARAEYKKKQHQFLAKKYISSKKKEIFRSWKTLTKQNRHKLKLIQRIIKEEYINTMKKNIYAWKEYTIRRVNILKNAKQKGEIFTKRRQEGIKRQVIQRMVMIMNRNKDMEKVLHQTLVSHVRKTLGMCFVKIQLGHAKKRLTLIDKLLNKLPKKLTRNSFYLWKKNAGYHYTLTKNIHYISKLRNNKILHKIINCWKNNTKKISARNLKENKAIQKKSKHLKRNVFYCLKSLHKRNQKYRKTMNRIVKFHYLKYAFNLLLNLEINFIASSQRYSSLKHILNSQTIKTKTSYFKLWVLKCQELMLKRNKLKKHTCTKYIRTLRNYTRTWKNATDSITQNSPSNIYTKLIDKFGVTPASLDNFLIENSSPQVYLKLSTPTYQLKKCFTNWKKHSKTKQKQRKLMYKICIRKTNSLIFKSFYRWKSSETINNETKKNYSPWVFAYSILKSLSHYFKRWKNNGDKKILHQIIIEDEKIYNDLCDKYSQLENVMHAVKTENIKLRQASLDGIAIADALESINEEREQLALDLTKKSLEIAKLKEENDQLCEKLSRTLSSYEPFNR